MITVKNLTKYYGDVHALKGINFEIEQGEIVGILGPNGAGKSTTLRILTSFLSKTDGEAIINGKNIEDNALSIKKIIGYLPESAPLYNDMIVYDYLSYIALIQDVEKSNLENRINYVVDACNLKTVIDKPISTLSKGYKQRVGLAGSIIHDPQILILDEPTNGLDPNQIVEIRELIKTLGKEKTVLLSTHILSEVEATCSRVIIINNGEIIADSPTDKLIVEKEGSISIKLSLKTEDNIGFIANRFKELDIVIDIKEEDSKENDIKNMIIITKPSKADPRDAIYEVIKNTNWIVYQISREKEDLESIFQTLTKGDK